MRFTYRVVSLDGSKVEYVSVRTWETYSNLRAHLARVQVPGAGEYQIFRATGADEGKIHWRFYHSL